MSNITVANMNLLESTRLLTGGDEMNMREKLASLPYSYDDFVRFTMQCIEQDDGIKDAIDNQFRLKPDSDTNDITKVVVDFLGLNEPIKLVDDDNEGCRTCVGVIETEVRTSEMAGAAY